MTGMNRGVSTSNPIVISAFHTSLVHQLLIIFGVAIVLILAWNLVRTIQYRHEMARQTPIVPAAGPAFAEPRARLVLRIAFGVIWTFDGLLQLQSSMPLGLPTGVITPAATGSPGWVQRLVSIGTTIWTNHPVTAATSAVWIQIGIGIALLVAPRGAWSRFAGLATVGWGLIVWGFGEAFGGMFAPGASFLFGLPGAAVFYVIAGVLIALPDSVWRTATLGRWLLRGLGLFLVGMGLLQAWPGRGTWSGQATAHATPGMLTAMESQMAAVPQPSTISSWLRSFTSFDAAHGWGVNLFVVVVLVAVGLCLLSARPKLALVGVCVGVVAFLADWVLVQDFGFFGGVGTDPNSMVPLSVVVVASYLAMVRPSGSSPVQAPQSADVPARRRLDAWTPIFLLKVAATLLAIAVVVIGAAPMAIASTNPNADAILTEAINGTPNAADIPAFPFSLVDQHGARVTLASLKGSVVVLTFLDPVCTSDCPLLGQELRAADGAFDDSTSVRFVAVVANPLYRSLDVVNAYLRDEGLTHVANWLFLTGSVGELEHVWQDYGVQVTVEPGGAMVDHSDLVDVIDRTGALRATMTADPGNSAALHSSFTTLLEAQIRRVEAL